MIPVERLTPKTRVRFLKREGTIEGRVRESAENILQDFRKDPDGTLRKLTKKYDGVDLQEIQVSPQEIDTAGKRVPQNVQIALRGMYDSVVRYHKNGVQKAFEISPVKGVTMGKLIVPFDRAGLYVPGGRAVYPSCVIMAGAPPFIVPRGEMIRRQQNAPPVNSTQSLWSCAS